MINKLIEKVKKEMYGAERDMKVDAPNETDFYRGVITACQVILDMAEETKAENYIYTNDLKNTIIDGGEDLYMAEKGVPKHDGSGGGYGGNAGRGGCANPKGRRKIRKVNSNEIDDDFIKAIAKTIGFDYDKSIFDK